MYVNIRETIEKVIEAKTVEEVEARYRSGEIILGAEDIKTVEITIINEGD